MVAVVGWWRRKSTENTECCIQVRIGFSDVFALSFVHSFIYSGGLFIQEARGDDSDKSGTEGKGGNGKFVRRVSPLHTVSLNWITILLYFTFVQLKIEMFETLSPCISHIRRIVHQSLKIPFHIPSIGAECWALCVVLGSNKTRTYGNDGDGCCSSLAPYSTYQRFDQPQMHLTPSKQRQRDPYAIYVSFVPSFLLDNGRDMVFHFPLCVCMRVLGSVWFVCQQILCACIQYFGTLLIVQRVLSVCCARSIVLRRRKTEETYTDRRAYKQATAESREDAMRLSEPIF